MKVLSLKKNSKNEKFPKWENVMPARGPWSQKFSRPLIVPVTPFDRPGYCLMAIWPDVLNVDKSVRVKIEIPAGFEYDGASVPRWLWSITNYRPDGLHRRAALVHDYLYMSKGLGLTRKQVDKVFKAQMIEDNVPARHAQRMYLAVRAFGSIPWRQKPKSLKLRADLVRAYWG